MQIEFEGESLTLDLDEIDVNEARIIKRHSGMSLIPFQDALWSVDPDCVVLAYWLTMRQSGKPAVDLQKANFKVVKFSNALADAVLRERAEQKAREEANPTGESSEPAEPTS